MRYTARYSINNPHRQSVPYRYHCEAALLQHCVNPASFAREVFQFEPDATRRRSSSRTPIA